MELENYLNRELQRSTVKAYKREIELYLSNTVNPSNANYQDILSYLNEQRKYQKVGSLNRILQSIKKYYSYLVSIEARVDNPAKNIYLRDYKGHRAVGVNSLLTADEIQKLWSYFVSKDYRYKLLKNRNISMIGLLLKQGLRMGELRRLLVEDVDLENAQINIRKSIRTKGRVLPLASEQIIYLYKYLEEDRAKLLKSPQESLFISKLGKAEQGENAHYLVSLSKKVLSKSINPKIIRMSVIAQQFKQGKSLQEVQYFAGHIKPSTTERYKSSDLEALEESVKQYHPLG